MAKADIFKGVVQGEPHKLNEHEVALPILYYRQDTFFGMYGADMKAVKDALPSKRMKPISVWPGRAAAMLNAFNYIETSIGPYGEFSLGFPCRVAHQGRRILGVYVHRLPVTTDIALQAGKQLWGYPKFIAEMEFESDGADNVFRMAEGDELICEWRTQKAGLGFGFTAHINTFTVQDGEIVLTELTAQGVMRSMPQGLAVLKTGPHKMGVEMAGLRLGERPITTGEFHDLRVILPEGERIGPA